MGDSNSADGDMKAASKVEPAPDATPSSIESTPERDAGAEPAQEPVQPQKRKGGRKPIYATSEERKQRNRQAQAAFRERRTEYIKQLEATIKQNEDTLAGLQSSHRTAADECLMLRYKNSLLERILLEKGIDVQAELRMKTGSPVLGPGFMQSTSAHSQPTQPPQLQRAALQRQQARRSGQNFLPKLAPGQPSSDLSFSTTSPLSQPTPSSHTSSPSQFSMRSPMPMHQNGVTPPTSAASGHPQAQHFQNFARSSQQQPGQAFYQAQQQSANIQAPLQRPTPSHHHSNTSGVSSASVGSQPSVNHAIVAHTNAAGSVSAASALYSSPFQKHFDQLDQEYDTQHSRSMLDHPDQEDVGTHRSPELNDSYPPQFDHPQVQHHPAYYQQPSQSMQSGQHSQGHFEQQQQLGPPQNHAGGPNDHFELDTNTTMMDPDPFGLSASMHYPTNYTFDHPQIQQ